MTTTQALDTRLFPNFQTMSFSFGGREYTFETGRMAKAATGSVVISCQDTVVLVTVTGSDSPRAGIDFFPLLCDFEEKMYSVGRMPGGYLKREGRPSERAVLTCRLMDRPIRPLWPDGYRNDVQIVATPLSSDSVIQLDMMAMLGASMALELSGLPFQGPIGAVRIGRLNGEFVVNPTYEESDLSELDLVVAGTYDSIMMVEAGSQFVTEEDMLAAIELAHNVIREQIEAQRKFTAQCGVVKKEFVSDIDLKPLTQFVESRVEADVTRAYHEFDRDARKTILDEAKKRLEADVEALPEEDPIKVFLKSHVINYLAETFKKIEKRVMRAMILNEGVRADGRKVDEIRPIFCEVGIVPRTHGTGLFTRGGTQVLSVCTLGSPGDAQKLDGVDPATEKRWMHHYAFPPYSVGEVRPLRGAGRREIGHGALVERAILPVLPPKEEFAYTIRVNSDVLESNGSTSMGSTCGTTLALMDAGVPIKAPIGGIAMGLIKEGDQYKVLSDIQGVEDFLGDMDFKVTGSRDGITALQMDIKIQGISLQIMKEALEQARVGRLHIMDKMAEAIPAPRNHLSPFAPMITSFSIPTDLIGTVIGPGGKTIRGIIEQTGTTIDIEDSGLVTVTSPNQEGGEQAMAIIRRLTMKIEPGMIMVGRVVRIIPAGAFVELIPGKDGMVHISQIMHKRVEKVEDVLKVGDEVLVRVVEIDDRGRVNLTIKGVSDEDRIANGFPPHPPREPRVQPEAQPAG